MSVETTCGLLFGRTDLKGPAVDGTNIVTAVANGENTVNLDDIQAAVDGLEGAQKNADESLTPYIGSMVDMLNTIADAANGGEVTLNFVDFKASAAELLHICRG